MVLVGRLYPPHVETALYGFDLAQRGYVVISYVRRRCSAAFRSRTKTCFSACSSTKALSSVRPAANGCLSVSPLSMNASSVWRPGVDQIRFPERAPAGWFLGVCSGELGVSFCFDSVKKRPREGSAPGRLLRADLR